MTALPDDILAALAAEETMLAEPWAGMLESCNRPAEPSSPAEVTAMIERSMRDMWSTPWGAPAFSWWRKPPRRLSLFRLGGEWQRQLQRSAWREAGRSAWIDSVRERLQSAVYAASNGYVWSWTAPGVFGVPGLPETLQVRHEGQPWRPNDSEENPDA